MLWKLAEHTEEENRRWCWMRAVEWCAWPLFVSQPFIPPLLFFVAPQTLLVSVVVVGWVWALIRYRFVDADLASVGCIIVVFLKWPSALICGGLFLWRAEYGLAALSVSWPAVTLGLGFLTPSGLIGVIEKKFIAQLLRTPESALFGEPYRQPWSDSIASYLTPLFFLAVVCGVWFAWTQLRPAAATAQPAAQTAAANWDQPYVQDRVQRLQWIAGQAKEDSQQPEGFFPVNRAQHVGTLFQAANPGKPWTQEEDERDYTDMVWAYRKAREYLQSSPATAREVALSATMPEDRRGSVLAAIQDLSAAHQTAPAATAKSPAQAGPELVPVSSSALRAVGYDAERRILEIEFQNGAVYCYYDVPAEVHLGLMAADSHGRYFNQQIRGAFRYKRIEPNATPGVESLPGWETVPNPEGGAIPADRQQSAPVASTQTGPSVADFARAYFNRGLASFGKGDWDDAIADYREAIRLNPTDAVAYYNRGLAYVGKREPDKAIADYTEAIRRAPDYADAYYARGNAFSGKGDWDDAIADYTMTIRVDSKYTWAYYGRGVAHFAKREMDLAIADHSEAIRIDPKFAWAYCNRGNAWREKLDYDKAIADYDKAVELDAKYALAYYNRGLAYASKGDDDKANTDFDQAKKLGFQPHGVVVLHGGDKKGSLHVKAGDEVDENLEEVYGLGLMSFTQGDFDRCIADRTEAIRLDPKSAFAYGSRGATYALKGDYGKAIADLTQAIRLDPRDAERHFVRGAAYAGRGDGKAAIIDLNEAIRLNPKYAAAYWLRGVTYLQKGESEKAKVDFDEATNLGVAKNGMAFAPRIHDEIRANKKQTVWALARRNPACLLETDNLSGYAPLHTAAQNGFKEISNLLLLLGADVNVRAKNGETPLITAVKYGSSGWTSPRHQMARAGFDLKSAVAKHRVELVLFFIAKGADVNATTHDGETALHFAATENMPAVAQALLDNGAAVDARTVEGETPLDRAYGHDSKEVISVLLKCGADPKARRADRKTPLEVGGERSGR